MAVAGHTELEMSTSPNFVSDNPATYLVDAPTRSVKLFRNGANQAVRIPREFELPGKDAIMRKEGDRLIIEPEPVQVKKGTAAALLAALASMKDWEPIMEEFPDVDAGLLPLDDIVL